MELLLVGLTLIFVTLKLLKKIDWSWAACLAPIWAPLFIAFIVGLVTGVMGS
jgi:hypothetical protein